MKADLAAIHRMVKKEYSSSTPTQKMHAMMAITLSVQNLASRFNRTPYGFKPYGFIESDISKPCITATTGCSDLTYVLSK